MTYQEHEEPVQRTSLIGAIVRYWWIVLLCAVAFLALGLMFTRSQPDGYKASAELILTDSQAQSTFSVSDAFGPSNQDSERYLADQVAFLRSAELAVLASDSIGGEISPDSLQEHSTVLGDLTSNHIVVVFDASDPATAKMGADAIASTYVRQRELAVEESTGQAIASLDMLIAEADARLAEIEAEIASISEASPSHNELNQELAVIQDQLITLRQARDESAIGSDARADFNAQIDELLRDAQALEVLLRADEPDPRLTALQTEQQLTAAERATLVARRNSISVDSELVGSGVALYSAAPLPEDPEGLPMEIVLAAALVLGLALGAAIAYGRSLAKKDFEDKLEPEEELDAPIIGEIPSGKREGVKSGLPMVDAPGTALAESFRFIGAAISTQQTRARAAGADPASIVGVVGATEKDGASVVSANVAVALAQEGQKVAVIDANVVTRSAARLLAPSRGVAGLEEASTQPFAAPQLVTRVSAGTTETVGVLAADATGTTSPGIFRDAGVAKAIASLLDEYDLVILSAPPLLEFAYARSVLDLADATLVVVGHGTKISTARELHDQLQLADIPLAGYVYNRALEIEGRS